MVIREIADGDEAKSSMVTYPIVSNVHDLRFHDDHFIPSSFFIEILARTRRKSIHRARAPRGLDSLDSIDHTRDTRHTRRHLAARRLLLASHVVASMLLFSPLHVLGTAAAVCQHGREAGSLVWRAWHGGGQRR